MTRALRRKDDSSPIEQGDTTWRKQGRGPAETRGFALIATSWRRRPTATID